LSWTKKQFIEAALNEIGIASSSFDIQPDEYEAGLRRLDALMGDWNARGIRIGYPLSATQSGSNLEDQTSVPDSAYEAIIANLGMKLASSYGREVPREVKVSAKRGYLTLASRAGVFNPATRQIPDNMPLGAGNRPHRNNRGNYFPTPEDPLRAGPDSEFEFT